jgi:putative Mg2+ transporter-C (MgtC) family protein
MAIILGGLLGLEREFRHRGAGFRTHILVCLGSTLIMLTSLYVFDIYKDIATIDPSRIAASVVTGIGFLCAGTILRYGASVRGLTTAASLWIAAGIGLALGCGFFIGAIVAALLAIFALYALRNIDRKLYERR